MNQGGTADKYFYSSLTECIILSGAFFIFLFDSDNKRLSFYKEVNTMLLTKRWRQVNGAEQQKSKHNKESKTFYLSGGNYYETGKNSL